MAATEKTDVTDVGIKKEKKPEVEQKNTSASRPVEHMQVQFHAMFVGRWKSACCFNEGTAWNDYRQFCTRLDARVVSICNRNFLSFLTIEKATDLKCNCTFVRFVSAIIKQRTLLPFLYVCVCLLCSKLRLEQNCAKLHWNFLSIASWAHDSRNNFFPSFFFQICC